MTIRTNFIPGEDKRNNDTVFVPPNSKKGTETRHSTQLTAAVSLVLDHFPVQHFTNVFEITITDSAFLSAFRPAYF